MICYIRNLCNPRVVACVPYKYVNFGFGLVIHSGFAGDLKFGHTVNIIKILMQFL